MVTYELSAAIPVMVVPGWMPGPEMLRPTSVGLKTFVPALVTVVGAARSIELVAGFGGGVPAASVLPARGTSTTGPRAAWGLAPLVRWGGRVGARRPIPCRSLWGGVFWAALWGVPTIPFKCGRALPLDAPPPAV